MHAFTTRPAAALAWIALLGLAVAVYWPGLSGGFLFDDYVNLDALGRNGAITDWPGTLRYLSSGTADPLGRPLSLLSFLLDARNWPADPAPFLRTNLCIHLGNASLLALLLFRLERALQGDAERARWIAVLGAGLWLLHPLWVSTTLYVVQREAMLPASFILLGLLAYAHGREQFARSAGSRGMAWMIAGIVAGTALASLCKANGLLLPLLALVVEYFVFGASPAFDAGAAAERRLARLKLGMLWLPSLMLALYLGYFLLQWNQVLAGRDWTIGQRVLTEPRVLFQYLGLLVVPRSVSAGVFNDQVQASAGLLSPWTTFVAVAGLLALAWAAFRHRRQSPALAAAFAFFLAGQALESSVVPLELYFEHRNYVPALLLGWPLARALYDGAIAARVRVAMAAVILCLLALTTWARAGVWGQPDSLAALWALQNPQSGRAQASAAIALLESGQAGRARDLLEPLRRSRPLDLQIAVNYLDASCAANGRISREDQVQMAQTLARLPLANDLLFRWFSGDIDRAASRSCQGVDLATVSAWLAAAKANPRLGSATKFEQAAGQLALAQGDIDLAERHLTRALELSRRPEDGLRHAAWLASAGHPREALRQLDLYPRLVRGLPPTRPGMAWLHEKLLQHQGYWENEYAWMRRQIEAMDASGRDPAAGGDGK